MNENAYSFKDPRIEFHYEFRSVSAEKEVQKVVSFTLTDISGVYNLALLDVLPDGQTSDITETKNKDMILVLATVVQIIIDFFSKNPGVYVLIRGSDSKRQRLYQILINREWDIIKEQFEVLGGNGLNLENFETNDTYEYFIISKIQTDER